MNKKKPKERSPRKIIRDQKGEYSNRFDNDISGSTSPKSTTAVNHCK